MSYVAEDNEVEDDDEDELQPFSDEDTLPNRQPDEPE